jgi:phage terminase large subunit GpA-like protein
MPQTLDLKQMVIRKFIPIEESLSHQCYIKKGYFENKIRLENMEKTLMNKEDAIKYYEEVIASLSQVMLEMAKGNAPVFIFLREELSKIKQVTSIYYDILEDESFDMWVVIKESDLNVEREVSQIFRKSLKAFRNIDFDFMILPKIDEDTLTFGMKKLL